MVAVASTRAGGPADAVDGVVPELVSEPDTPEALAATLAWASSDRLLTVIRGGGTKLGWGRVPASLDLLIRTSRAGRRIVHRHGDLTATASAGVTLLDLNRELEVHGQWLPIDSAFEDATIGGILATNDAGPLRHRYGTPRDLLIGITLALADGRIVKAGGNVVKNVAGYDLGKLVTGSFGTLAVILDATFKLLPVLRSSKTVVAAYASADRLATDMLALAASQLEPVAFDVRVTCDAVSRGGSTACHLLLRYASSPDATEAQVAGARALISSDTTMRAGESELAAWRQQVAGPWDGSGSVVRMSWLPSKLPHVVTLLADLHQAATGALTLIGRVGTGAGFLRIEGSTTEQAAVVARLRARGDVVGNVVVLRASRELKAAVDVWGEPADSIKVLGMLKRTFDPAGILNAGRGPI